MAGLNNNISNIFNIAAAIGMPNFRIIVVQGRMSMYWVVLGSGRLLGIYDNMASAEQALKNLFPIYTISNMQLTKGA